MAWSAPVRHQAAGVKERAEKVVVVEAAEKLGEKENPRVFFTFS